jgi:aminoglycoside phosphotransferase (APT) family kinase protein
MGLSPSFDSASLARWLRDRLPGAGAALEIAPLAGGQSNPTFLLRTGGREYVLRKKPAGVLLPSAHAVDREYRVMTALADTDVPVPRTYCYCDDRSVIGTEFFVMDFMPGRAFMDPALPELAASERAALYDDVNRVIAALHSVDYAAIGLADYGRPGNYFERQIGRWSKQYRASETATIAAMDALIEWLPQHVPPGDDTSIVHGDFRLDNLIVHPREPRVIALLDWELSTLGHPLADFAYHVMAWRLTAAEFRGMAGRDLAALGIPQEREYVAAYCRRTGRADIAPAQWTFYLAFSMFRLAAILQGIAKRAIEGTSASANAAAEGARARAIAEIAWRGVQALA